MLISCLVRLKLTRPLCLLLALLLAGQSCLPHGLVWCLQEDGSVKLELGFEGRCVSLLAHDDLAWTGSADTLLTQNHGDCEDIPVLHADSQRSRHRVQPAMPRLAELPCPVRAQLLSIPLTGIAAAQVRTASTGQLKPPLKSLAVLRI